MALVNYLWLILMNVGRTSYFWRTFGSWLPCMETFLSSALCKWHGFTICGGCFKLIWSSFCSQGAAVEQWRLLVLLRVPAKKYLNLLWAWMGHGLSRCFPFSNKIFLQINSKSSFCSAPCCVQQICTVMYISACVQESHVCKTDFHLDEGHGNWKNIKKLVVPSQVAGRSYNFVWAWPVNSYLIEQKRCGCHMLQSWIIL